MRGEEMKTDKLLFLMYCIKSYYLSLFSLIGLCSSITYKKKQMSVILNHTKINNIPNYWKEPGKKFTSVILNVDESSFLPLPNKWIFQVKCWHKSLHPSYKEITRISKITHIVKNNGNKYLLGWKLSGKHP